MNCPRCGKSIKENAAFCVFCGTRLAESSFSIPSTSSSVSKGAQHAAPETKQMNMDQGTRLFNNRYAIEKEIGRGGMGRVFLALDTKMDGRVVIKEMLPQAADTVNRQYMEKRFVEEAKLLFNLKHSGLPGVLDYFVEGSSLCLVMEFINGKNLEDLQQDYKNGQVSIKDGLDWMKQIIDILIFLHSQNPPVVHRDIKPANILLTPEGRIYLVDFGVARTLGLQSHTQTAVGTYGYASPEHYSGKFTLASDIYSLGATFHHLFSGASPQENEPFKFSPLSGYRSDVPTELDALITRMTKQERTERYAKIEDVLSDIRKIGTGEQSGTKKSTQAAVVAGESLNQSKSTRINLNEIQEEPKPAKKIKKKKDEGEKQKKRRVAALAAAFIAFLMMVGIWQVSGNGKKHDKKPYNDNNVSKTVAVKEKVKPSPTMTVSPSPTASASPTITPSPSPSETEPPADAASAELAQFPEETHPQANEGYFIECGRFDNQNNALITAKRLKTYQFNPTIGKEEGWFVVYAANSADPLAVAEFYDKLKTDSFEPIIVSYKTGKRQEMDRNSPEFQPAEPIQASPAQTPQETTPTNEPVVQEVK